MKVFVVTIDDADITKVPAVFRKEEEAKTYLIEGFVNQFGNDDEEIIKIDKALKKAKLNKTPNKPDYSLHLWLRYWEGMEDDEEYDEEEYDYTEEDDELYNDDGIEAAKKYLKDLLIDHTLEGKDFYFNGKEANCTCTLDYDEDVIPWQGIIYEFDI